MQLLEIIKSIMRKFKIILNKRLLLLILFLIGTVVILIASVIHNNIKITQQRLIEEPKLIVDNKKVERIRQEIAWSSSRKTGDWPIYSTENFKIEYAPRAVIFFATILKPPFEENKKAIEDWFVSKGLNSKELCEMRIVFIASKEVKQSLLKADIASTGCGPITDFFPQATGPTGR